MAAGDSVISRLVAPFMHCTKKTITLTGALTQDVFSITGVVEAWIVGVCTTKFADTTADNVSLGTAASTQLFIANTACNNVDAGEIWVDSSPSAISETIPTSILAATATVILTGSVNTTSGVVDFYCFWTPVSSDSVVSAA